MEEHITSPGGGLAQMLGVGVGVELLLDEVEEWALPTTEGSTLATGTGTGRLLRVPLPLLSCDLRRL